MTERTGKCSYRFGIFDLQTKERRLLQAGKPVSVGPRAFDLLVALVERRDELVTKEELLDSVWPGLVVEENNLQVQVSALRKIVGQGTIATIPGRGYRFTAAVTETTAAGSPTTSSRGNDAAPTPPALRTLLAPIDESAPSIAVLPFVNLSDDATNEYFADGVAEELLNVLSKVRGLRVASRTSAFSFKGSKVDILAVAQRLSVATVLQGSVRKAGNRVRIAVQLVQAATDSHLWSETYDRELQDIFAVQDDIAQSVVKELRPMFLPGQQRSPLGAAVQAEVRAATKGRGENAEAYRLYLQGRFLVGRRTKADLTKGIEYLQRAVALDPKYALAWAGLSYARSVEAFTGWTERRTGYGHARAAAERALALEPDLAEAQIALAHVRLLDDYWDWSGADALARRALESAPGNAEVVLGAAWTAGTLGRLDESIALCRRAIALDPLNALGHRYLGYFSLFAGYLPQAEAALKEALELNPLGAFTCAHLGQVYQEQGRFPEALAAFKKESHSGYRLLGLSIANFALGRKAPSSAALERLNELPEHAFLSAQAYAYCGNVDVAFEWLERAYSRRDTRLCHIKLEPFLRNLHGDPRWRTFLKKMGLTGE